VRRIYLIIRRTTMRYVMALLALAGLLGFSRVAQADESGTIVIGPGTNSVPKATVFDDQTLRLERKPRSGGTFRLDSLQPNRDLAERKASYLQSLGYQTRIVPVPSAERRVAEGRSLFLRVGCADCHRPDGRG
jgi:mono/diheme cytochrome c family protein